MEKLNVNQKSLKQAKGAKKKAPLKVVYISNPVKLTATAAQFRALVQELTGRHSNIADTMADQYDAIDSSTADAINGQDDVVAAGEQKIDVGVVVSKGIADHHRHHHHQAVSHHEVVGDQQEAFSSPLLENFSALCESQTQHVGNGFWEY